MRAPAFGKLPLVAARCFSACERGLSNGAAVFQGEWSKDPTVVVRCFTRVVRAGGASVPCVAVVVRRRRPMPLEGL